jgi:hypothetical protein
MHIHVLYELHRKPYLNASMYTCLITRQTLHAWTDASCLPSFSFTWALLSALGCAAKVGNNTMLKANNPARYKLRMLIVYNTSHITYCIIHCIIL